MKAFFWAGMLKPLGLSILTPHDLDARQEPSRADACLSAFGPALVRCFLFFLGVSYLDCKRSL